MNIEELEKMKREFDEINSKITPEEWTEMFKQWEKDDEEAYYNSYKVKEFYKQLELWENKTCYLSNATAILACEHLARIIGLGSSLMRAVLKELPKNWFLYHVLQAWTGVTTPKDIRTPAGVVEWWQKHLDIKENWLTVDDV